MTQSSSPRTRHQRGVQFMNTEAHSTAQSMNLDLAAADRHIERSTRWQPQVDGCLVRS